jgi:hypothetical protein
MESRDGRASLDAVSLPMVLAALGELLTARGLHYEAIAIGGGALLLLGYITRATRDLDLLALVESGRLTQITELPAALAEAVEDTARRFGLTEDWLNAKPSSLLDLGLPAGFSERLETRRYGGLTLGVAGRGDQIAFKLYAAVDQGPASKHVDDLWALAPTRDELIGAARWTRTHDPSEGFQGELRKALRHFGITDDVDL